MFRKPQVVVLVVMATVGILLVSLPVRATDRVKSLLGWLFLPLMGLAEGVSDVSDSIQVGTVSRAELFRELSRLRQENAKLRVAALKSKEIFRENGRLRREIEWKARRSWRLKAGRVILQDPSNWWRSVQINLGYEEGLVEDLPVLTSLGLIGKTARVERHRSVVFLVGDPNCPVAALVRGDPASKRSEWVVGIIKTSGRDVRDWRMVELQMLPPETVLEPGARVLTSGLGGVFPRGIPIGRIVDSRKQSFGLYADARIELAADFRRLDLIWVILPAEKSGGAAPPDQTATTG